MIYRVFLAVCSIPSCPPRLLRIGTSKFGRIWSNCASLLLSGSVSDTCSCSLRKILYFLFLHLHIPFIGYVFLTTFIFEFISESQFLPSIVSPRPAQALTLKAAGHQCRRYSLSPSGAGGVDLGRATCGCESCIMHLFFL